MALALALFQGGCIVLPARITSGVNGVVIDAVTRKTLAGAIVVVRFDGRYGDVLPDREVLGHRETRTDHEGRFRVPPLVRPGLSAWPLYKTGARVVAVILPGYRCAKPVAIQRQRVVKILLQPALDVSDQRDSCRPVPVNRGEADDYMMAWRALYPEKRMAREAESERQITRLLEARASLGFGENCRGPVTDLALSQDGRHAGYSAGSEMPTAHLVEFNPERTRPPRALVKDDRSPPRRLAWTSAGDLVLWEPATDANRSISLSIFGPDRFEVVWQSPRTRVAPPAAPKFRARHAAIESPPKHPPLDPADLNDEGDSRWLGRTFSLQRTLDPTTRLPNDRLAAVLEDGTHYEIPLPGEACGPHGRFGRPHYRITAAGDAGVDLRFVDGGCHAVKIDLTTGAWKKLDEHSDAAVCNETRNIPASYFSAALRSYAREVHLARTEAGGDATASYALIIAPNGSTRVETRNNLGEAISAEVPDFPLLTPLRRINVALLGTVYEAPSTPSSVPDTRDLNPL